MVVALDKDMHTHTLTHALTDTHTYTHSHALADTHIYTHSHTRKRHAHTEIYNTQQQDTTTHTERCRVSHTTMLQCVAVFCSVLQCVAVCCGVHTTTHTERCRLSTTYEVATISRLLKIIGPFCRI